MFKKTLLALALTGAAVTASATSLVDTAPGTPVAISSQGLPATKATTLFTAASDVALNGLAGGVGTEYMSVAFKASDASVIVNGSRLVIEIDGAFFADPSTAVATPTAITGAAALGTDDYDIVTADSTSTKLVFALTDANNSIAAGLVDDEIVRVGNFDLIVTGTTVSTKAYIETASKVKVASTEGSLVSIATVSNQWVAGVVDDVASLTPTSGKLNAKIDVGDDRETFESAATSDTLTFDVNTQGSGATLNDVTVTIEGDFTGVKSVVAANNGSATYAINSAKTEATYTYTGATDTTMAELTANQSVVTFSLNTAAADVVSLDARSFDMTLDIDYDDAESVQHNLLILDDVDAGKWDLNGTTHTVEYMPYGPNTQVIFQATSTFDEDVTYDISYLNEDSGKMVTLEDVGTIGKMSVSKLGGDIAAAIMADAGTTSGKTRVILSVNAPTGDVEFFTAFKDTNDADRLGIK
jgi:hypothetical protein